MSRNVERKLLMITGCWQIFHGLVSVIYFGIIKRANVIADVYSRYGHRINLTSITSFIYLFGLIMVILGIINLVVSKNYMNDDTINRTGYWLIAVVVISFFSSDLISFILTMSATVLYFSKNKAINTLKNQ